MNATRARIQIARISRNCQRCPKCGRRLSTYRRTMLRIGCSLSCIHCGALLKVAP